MHRENSPTSKRLFFEHHHPFSGKLVTNVVEELVWMAK
jgi:hypothetical protein